MPQGRKNDLRNEAVYTPTHGLCANGIVGSGSSDGNEARAGPNKSNHLKKKHHAENENEKSKKFRQVTASTVFQIPRYRIGSAPFNGSEGHTLRLSQTDIPLVGNQYHAYHKGGTHFYEMRIYVPTQTLLTAFVIRQIQLCVLPKLPRGTPTFRSDNARPFLPPHFLITSKKKRKQQ